MKDVLEWVVARGYRLALAAAFLSLLPLLGVLAQSLIVLAVLVRGFGDGLLVALAVAGVTVLPAIITGAVPGSFIALPVLLLVFILTLAVVLQRSRSLSLTVQIATMIVAAGVGLAFLLGDPLGFWNAVIADNAARMPAQFSQLPAGASEFATGAAGLLVLLGTVVSVFIARWWQSILQRPGAFGIEFRGLQLGAVIAVLASVVFVAAGITGVAAVTNITLVLATAYLLQGLAVLHAAVAATDSGSFWLVSVYALLILAMPFALAVAGFGFVDSWFNFRSRLKSR